MTTKVGDDIGNTYFVDNFIYEIDEDLLKVKNLVSKDSQQNTFKSSVAYINTNSRNVFGKDIVEPS